MKVAVIGPGALGSVFAARMQRAGVRVSLIDHNLQRMERLERNGVTIEAPNETYSARPSVLPHVPTGQDLVLVLTKSYATADLRFPPETPVLTLQNGLGHVETLCSMVGSARVLAGSTSEAATWIEEGRVRHVAEGQTIIGAWTSCPTESALQALEKAGFDAEVTESPGQLIWEKAALCAGINPLTALLNVPNGRLLELREARQIMRDLVVEAAKVAATEGYRFQHSLVEKAEDLCEQTAGNISSMLQDVRAGKQTEIDALSGEILRRAQLASLPTPRTRMIYQLVRSLEQR